MRAIDLHPCISLDSDDRISQPVPPRKDRGDCHSDERVLDGIGQVGPAAQDTAMTVGPSRLG